MSLDYFNRDNDDDDNVKIHSERLLTTLTKFNDLLGRVLTEAMINSLKYHGVDLTDNSRFYSLKDIQEALNEIVGDKASVLLLEHLKKQLAL